MAGESDIVENQGDKTSMSLHQHGLEDAWAVHEAPKEFQS